MKILNKLLLFSIIRSSVILIAIFFPIILFADFVFGSQFDMLLALKKLPVRYRDSLNNLIFWGVWLGSKNFYKKYDFLFLSIGFDIKKLFSFIFYLFFLMFSFHCFVLIPLNSLQSKHIVRTNWAIKKIDSDCYFIHRICDDYSYHPQLRLDKNFAYKIKKNIKKSFNMLEIYCNKDNTIDHQFVKLDRPIKKFSKNITLPNNISISERDFYIVWNATHSLSWYNLYQYYRYLKYHNFSTDDVEKQAWQFLFSGLLYLGLLFFAFAFAFRKEFLPILICAILSNWMTHVIFFFSLKVAIAILCFNFLIWLIIGLLCALLLF